MNASNQLISHYRKALSLTTNQAVADKLGVKQPTVSMWLNEKSHPDAESVARMCEATKEPLAKWLPLIEAERARSPEARKVWLRLAHLATAAALVMALFPAHAQAPSSGHKTGDVYIM